MGEARRQREPGIEANVAMRVHETPATSLLAGSPLNPPNRRMRTRMYGGVGGEKLRSSPLSRFHRLSKIGHCRRWNGPHIEIEERLIVLRTTELLDRPTRV